MNNKFSWNNFDEEFISSVVYSEKTNKAVKPKFVTNDKDMLIPTMDRICPYPDKEFVTTYRTEIEFRLLKKYPELIGKIYNNKSDIKGSNYYSMLNTLTMKTLGTILINKYIAAIYEIGGCDYTIEEQSKYALPVSIDLNKSIANDVPLYDFQKDAIKKLNENLIMEDKANGLLIMPTGSGKTRTAVYFLLRNMISEGYQVIWLTHRHMLIDQTADAFYNAAPIIKLQNPNAKLFKMACISEEHSSIKATEKNDNVMIMSVQSVCRNLDYLKSVLAKKVIIVVDEAHHTVASSYTRTINYIRKIGKDAKLLGLTATPVRGLDSESKYLQQLFDNNIFYSISMSELITKKILADPVFEHIETGKNFETVISIDEKKFVKKWGELPPTLVDKVAKSCERNDIIVDTYIKNKEKYGKTIIFALNAYHCISLSEQLQAKGVKCDYVYSLHDGNDEKICRFKDGELDVLVNINILTEGSDVPDIQTVFLTRPTQSEVLLMQMIGRGMRGISAGGTEKVIIVDFCDKWDTFEKWLNPEWLINTEIEASQPDKDTNEGRKPNLVPWELIRDILEGISYIGGTGVKRCVSMPYGWYSLLNGNEDYRMIIFEDQFNSFKNIIRDKKQILSDNNITANGLIEKYFAGFVTPPRREDMEIFLENLRSNSNSTYLFRFENRKEVDPVCVAKKIKEDNLNLFVYPDELYKQNPIIENLYGSLENYRQKIFEFINYGGNPIGPKVEEMPVELIPLSREPVYDLQELLKEVIVEMFGGEYKGISSVAWTDKPYKGYYGIYYADNFIKINSILNSKDVPREVVKYVIYHELLHRDYWRHDKEFKLLEHKYPNYTEHERFLDYKMSYFKMEM